MARQMENSLEVSAINVSYSHSNPVALAATLNVDNLGAPLP